MIGHISKTLKIKCQDEAMNCSTRKLWEFTLIPAIALLVDVGGPCEGATIVVQQDNAGPRIEEAYSTWMRDMFETLEWMYEPQAPQGLFSSYHN